MAAKPSKEVMSLLSAFDWKRAIDRLVLYATYKARYYQWRGIVDGTLPHGMNPQDVVSIAVEKVLNGERKWNPEKYPDLYLYLKNTVKSLLSNYTRSSENKAFVGDFELLMDIDVDDDDIASPIENLPSDCPTAEQELVDTNLEEECILTLYEFLNDKPFLQSMLECIEAGIDKPAAMADKLKVPVTEIYNAQKQMKRKLEEFKTVWVNRIKS